MQPRCADHRKHAEPLDTERRHRERPSDAHPRAVDEFERGHKGFEHETESTRSASQLASTMLPERAYRAPLPETGEDRRVGQGAARVEEVREQRAADRA